MAPPFVIAAQGVRVTGDPAPFAAGFARLPALALPDTFAPDFCAALVARAARASFVEDRVERLGTRAVEAPQRVGAALSLLLHSPALLAWIEAATGAGPLRAVAGRLVEARDNGRDALAWHDDAGDPARRLAVVIDLSERRYAGGRFELRRKGDETPLLAFDHGAAGSMLVFAVRPELEHRLTMVSAGGPRRVYAGWFLTHPEHATGALGGAVFG